MAIVRYNPWSFVSQLHGELDRAMRDWNSGETSSATADWVPAADVEEYEDRFELFVDLPGVAAKDVEITLEGGVLSLSGERKEEQATGQISRHRRERGFGKFYRRFILPDTVNADAVKAKERHGVLAVTIPKKAAAQPRRSEIAA
jgi:HSP20 family protein